MDEDKLTAMHLELQKLVSKYWELRAEMTELQSSLIAIREMIEDRQQH
jgi:prefoldin subunit 5